MTRLLKIKALRVDPIAGLLVSPEENEPSFQYIYRAATGIRWNAEHAAFVAYDPDRWSHESLFQTIRESVSSEFGFTLKIDEQTLGDDSLITSLRSSYD